MIYSKISGTGSYLPGKPISNNDLSELFDIDEWLVESIGIKNRYWAVDYRDKTLKQKGYEMAGKASILAIKDAGIQPKDIDKIIMATAVSDYIMPNSAVLVQEYLGINNIPVVEIHAACAGALQALEEADNTIKAQKAENILICSFNLMSPTFVRELTNDRLKKISAKDILNGCMFGDGASALVVSKSVYPGIRFIENKSVGVGRPSGMELLAGGAVFPLTQEVISSGQDKWKHDAKVILEHGSSLSKMGLKVLFDTNQLKFSDIHHFIFPQANPETLRRDALLLQEKFDVPFERIANIVEVMGNMSTPALFIALDNLSKTNKLKKGELIAMVGGEASKWLFGSALIEWQRGE